MFLRSAFLAATLCALASAFTAVPSIALRTTAAQRCAPLRGAADDEKARREAIAASKPRPPAQNDYLAQMSRPKAPESSAADDEKARREAMAASKPRPPAQNDYLAQMSRPAASAPSAADDEKARREAMAASKPRPPATNDYLSSLGKK
jgi:hypothetical protein